jgi:hypothetical protein
VAPIGSTPRLGDKGQVPRLGGIGPPSSGYLSADPRSRTAVAFRCASTRSRNNGASGTHAAEAHPPAAGG